MGKLTRILEYGVFVKGLGNPRKISIPLFTVCTFPNGGHAVSRVVRPDRMLGDFADA